METKTRILIADASADFSSLLGDLVAGEKDMEVVGVADNGVDALALITELKPDVLLLDLVLSKLDGLELLRRLAETGVKTHIIVLSGFVNNKVVGECSALGADYFISKPCDPAALLGRILPAPDVFAAALPGLLLSWYLGGVAGAAAALTLQRRWRAAVVPGLLLYPLFMASFLPLQSISLFRRPSVWKPIPHTGVRLSADRPAA